MLLQEPKVELFERLKSSLPVLLHQLYNIIHQPGVELLDRVVEGFPVRGRVVLVEEEGLQLGKGELGVVVGLETSFVATDEAAGVGGGTNSDHDDV